MLTIKLWQSSSNANWYFNIASSNGEKIAQSEGYTSRQNAAKTIDLIRGNAGGSSVVEYQGGRWVKLI